MEESVWKKVLKVASSVGALIVFIIIAYAEVYVLISSLLYEANRFLFGRAFLVLLMLALQVFLTFFFGISLFLSAYQGKEPKGILVLIGEVLTIAMGIIMPIVMYYGRATESSMFLNTLPYFLVGFIVMACLLILPLAKRKVSAVIVLLLISVLLIGGVSAFAAFGQKFEIEADPVVFDNGKDFSVVWATSSPSVGYLEYTYEGQKYRVYDAEDGKYRANDRVHTVHVPYEHLYGNSYTVSAAKVLKNAAKNSKIGDFITSRAYLFAQKVTGDSLKMLSLTDWHEKVDAICQVASVSDDYDLLLMMGDAINYVNEYEDIIDNVVLAGGKITKGEKPVLFVRGNHEPRGKYAYRLKSVLGYDSYYFTTSYGEENFLILDGGEDKPDDDPKNGGLFVSDAYRDAELSEAETWSVPVGNNVCLCHIPIFTTSETSPQYKRFVSLMEKWNVKLVVSGHEHFLDLVDGDGYKTLIAGGPTDDLGFVACRIDIAAGNAVITAINTKGETLHSYDPIALK